jgi:hypothetical protein
VPGERVLVIWSLKSTQIVGIVSVAAFTERKNVSYHRPPSFFFDVTASSALRQSKAKQCKAGREPRAESQRDVDVGAVPCRGVAWPGGAIVESMDIRSYGVSLCALNALLIAVKSWTPLPAHNQRRVYHREFTSIHALSAGASNIEDEECLIPEPNPNSNPNATSLSGVHFSFVTRGIDALYPPNELEKRNAQSRTDGYWKYVSRGEDPPKEFTYGEFDVEFFGELLDLAWKYFAVNDDGQPPSVPWTDKVFCDIGSGTGRLVLSAAALHPNWSLCRGLEILQTLHDVSVQILDECKLSNEESSGSAKYGLQVPTNESIKCAELEEPILHLPMAPIQFTCGSFLDEYEYLGNIDCAFVFSSCMKPHLLKELSIAIGRQMRPGSIIITTEFPLVLYGHVSPSEDDETMPHGEYEIELLDKVEGWCWLTGGESTAYIHRVKTSLWNEYAGPRTKPQMTLEDEAYRLVQLLESGQLTDTKAWWRDVHNELSFRGQLDCVSLEDLSYEDLIIKLLKLL